MKEEEQFPKSIESRIISWKENWFRNGDKEYRAKLASEIIGTLPRIIRHIRHLERQLLNPKFCPDCGQYPGQRGNSEQAKTKLGEKEGL
jgi:hypothetical protein